MDKIRTVVVLPAPFGPSSAATIILAAAHSFAVLARQASTLDLLSGGRGQSWEWLTDVTPKVSWKYNAVGKPLWSEAEGRTRLEDLGDGQTRVHFSESYRAFNPIMRVLLEKRVHDFISKDNDRLIRDSLTKGVQMMREARAKGTPGAS